jgi:5-methylcytosine-specific restriction endonuclease McrA
MRYTKQDKELIARARRQVIYETDDWSGRRAVVGYRCKGKCGGKSGRIFKSLDDLEVDHIKPLSKGGTERISNLQLLCTRCNRTKGSTTAKKSSTLKSKRR